jgi:hypothetical protein
MSNALRGSVADDPAGTHHCPGRDRAATHLATSARGAGRFTETLPAGAGRPQTDGVSWAQ